MDSWIIQAAVIGGAVVLVLLTRMVWAFSSQSLKAFKFQIFKDPLSQRSVRHRRRKRVHVRDFFVVVMSGLPRPLGVESPLRSKLLDILRSTLGIPAEEVEGVSMVDPPEEVAKGDHFGTSSSYAKVTFKDANQRDKNLFVKHLPRHAGAAAYGRRMRVMEKEAAFFNSFLPNLKQFVGVESSNHLLSFFPKFLYGDNSLIVMEHMVFDDTYFMLPKDQGHNLTTAKHVLTNLARFHASSYSFMQSHEGGVEGFVRGNQLLTSEAFLRNDIEIMHQMYDNGLTTCINILKGCPIEVSEASILTLESHLGHVFPRMVDLIKAENQGPLLVLNHGDCSNNNMLFKIDFASGEVKSHVLLDWQMTRLGSPCLDLGFYLYTSVNGDVRRAGIKDLLSHYFHEFQDTLSKFGHECPLSIQDFLTDYKNKSQLGFFSCLNFISAVGTLKKIDVRNLPSSPADVVDMFNDATRCWIQRNGEKATRIASEVVSVLREKEELERLELP